MTAAIARILRHKLQQGIRTLAPTTVGFGVLLLLFVGLFSYTRAYMPARVYAATSNTLNFQARLMSSAGSLVPDGSYSIQFKFYDAVSGGVNEWTETQGAVMVRNGYLSVQLGSVTPFGGSIDWSQEKWMTMNVNSDGEMNPRIKLTAVPYSFRSGQADSLTSGSGTVTADDLVQIAPSSAQAVNTALAALRINQTGLGGLLQLQQNGEDVFVVNGDGNLVSNASATFSGGNITLGSATQTGLLTLKAAGDYSLSLQAGAQSSNLSFTLPSSYGNDGECIKGNGAGALSFGVCGGGGTNSFINDGNSFSQLATLGTNDSFDLAFETGGVEQMRLDTAGNLGIGVTLPNEKLQVNGAINLGNTLNANAGTIRWTGLDFQGFDGSEWKSLTSSGGGGGTSIISGGGGLTSVKTADQTIVNNTVLQSATDLYVPIAADESRTFRFVVQAVSTAQANLQFAVMAPTGAVCKVGAPGVTGNLGCGVSFTVSSTGTDQVYEITGTVTNGATAGNIQLEWAQATNRNNHSATIYAGSYVYSTSTSPDPGATDTFLQGGNAFGATAVIGTMDNQAFNLITNGSTALSLATNGLATFNGAVTTAGGLTVNSGGASIIGGLDNNSGGITNSGDITGVGTNITAVEALTIASTGVGNLTLNSGSGLAVLGAATLRTADSLALDLSKATNTLLTLQNSGTGIANLNLGDGNLQTAGTTRLTNGGALQNITGLTVTSGGADITGNIVLGGSSSDRLSILAQLSGANPLEFQGATDNGFTTVLAIADPTANNVITLPNGSGTLVLDSRNIQTASGSGLAGGGNLGSDLNISLDIFGLTTKNTVNMTDYLAIYDDTTSSVKKISRADLLQGVIGALQYRGTWDAATNTPTLSDTTGANGDMYAVSSAATRDLGSGNITFGAGDFAIHNGTRWEVAPSAAEVDSVFGRTGSITAQSGDYSALQITYTPTGNLSATSVQAALNELDSEKIGSLNGLTASSQTFANDTNITITSSGSTHTLGWNGQLSVSRGGTGVSSFTVNGLLYGNSSSGLQSTAAGSSGQMIIADENGIPTFVSLNGDATVNSSGLVTISANSIALGTDTVGNYIASLGTLTGLTATGNTGEGSTPTLSVVYGSTSNSAVQGSITLICPSGTGNLTGGGNSITLGAGGTCNGLTTVNNPTFSTSVNTPILTSSSGLSITSGGSGNIILDSASDKLVIGASDTTLQRSAAGTYTIDLSDADTTTLTLTNTDTGIADLNIAEGALRIAGTSVLTNGRALQNLTGISTTGGLVFNSFAGSSGLLAVDSLGNVSVAAAGTGYEVPLTFDNGLTRTGNVVSLGGALTGLTDIALSGNNLIFSGTTGNIGIGATGTLGGRLHINTGADAARGLVIRQNSATQSGDLIQFQDSSGAYKAAVQADGVLNLGPVNGIEQISGISTLGDKIALFTSATFGRYGFGIQSGTLVAHLGTSTAAFAVRVDPGGSGAASSGGSNAFAVSGTGNGAFAGGLAVNGNSLSSNSSTFALLNTPTTITAFGAATALNLGVAGGMTTINGNLSVNSGTFSAANGLVSLNVNSNFGTNINTGSSTGTVSIGGGNTPLVIDTTNFDFDSTNGLSVIGSAQFSNRIYVPGTSGTAGQGYFIGTSGAPLSAFQGLDLGGNTYSFFATNKHFNGTTWVDNGLGRTGSSFQIQNDNFTFYSFDTAANFTPRFTVASGGNVGIGTSGAPSGLLSIGGSTGNFTVDSSGNVSTLGTTRLTAAGALQNVTGNNTNGVSFDANTITSGLLPVLRGGTGAGSFTTNGVIFGNNTGTLQVTAAGTGGQVLIANGSGVPTFTSLSGDVTIGSSGLTAIGSDAVALGADTTGSYIADITIQTGGGLVVSGTGGETATASLTIRRDCSNNQIVKWSTSGSGSWNCAADNSGLSDARVKNNVVTVNDNVFDKLKSVRVVEFDFDCTSPAFNNLHCNTDHQAGVIAQELELIFPELVFEDSNGYKNVRYDILGFYNMRALGQLATIIDAKGDAKLNNLQTGGIQRLTNTGQLQNINGLVIVSGGASIIGGINNNNSGLTNVGSISGATTINASGRITGTNGLSVTGETINLNANSDKATNINTGSSTGTVTIGGGSAPLVINSSAFKVSSAGALSGITTINTSGNINTGGVFQANGLSGLSGTCTGNNSYLQDWTITGGIITAGECRTGGILSDARLKENVVALDDSILTRIKDVNTVNFDFACDSQAFRAMNQTCDKERQTGVIAQELAQIFPELVYQNDDGYYRVKYDALNIYTLKATSQIAQKIDDIENGSNSAKTISTNGTVRINENGQLQNINGLIMTAGGVSVVGGINNNNSGITEAGSIGGVSELLAKRIVLSSQTNEVLVVERDGRNAMTIFQTGALELMFDDERAFAARRASGDDVFSISTSGGLVQVGSAASDASSVLLVLDNIDMEGDPPGINGAQYYNVRTQRFRCFQNGAWHNCLSAANAEYVIVPQSVSWQQPGGDQEFPGAPRVWIDLSQAQDFRITMQLKTVGASRANCYLQYAASDNGPWNDLSQSGRHIDIGAPGSIKSDWSAIASDARGEVLVRVMCRGGNYDESNVTAAAVPEFNSVRVQVR